MKPNAAALLRTRVVIGIAMAMGAGSAAAIEFSFGDGWKGNWNTTISAAQSWRAGNQDPSLYSLADGLVRGFTNGQGGSNTDSGNLNWDRNDTFSQVVKLLSDVSVEKNGTGGIIRFKAWYDNALNNNAVPFGNQGQRPPYSPGEKLSDYGLTMSQRYNGIVLLDAYGYTQFNIDETPVQVRLGNQVINWGEGLFIQGMNVTSPIDLPALRRGVGADLKEFLLPVPVAYANIGLPKGMSLEMFYQFQWKPTVVDACGTYFSPAENAVSYQTGNCNVATTFPAGTPAQSNNAFNISKGAFFRLVEGEKGSNTGNYGVAFRFPVSQIDTEFGTYYQHLSSRTPIISIKTGTPLPAPSAVIFLPGPSENSAAAFWEYPNDIQIFGLSAATNVAGWSIGSELSYWKDVPAQINGNDLLLGFLRGIGPVGAEARALAGRVAGTPAAPVGTVFHGYDLFHKTNFQINAVQLFSNVLGASNLVVVAEYGAQWNNVPDFNDGGVRYGRGFIYGNGTSPTIAGGANLCAVPPALGGNPQPQGCKNDGYITGFADGIRMRGTLNYNDVFMGVGVSPSLFYAYDINGVSIDSQFNQGRSTLALGVKFDYNKRYTLDVGYVTYRLFGSGGDYDNLRDRDFYSAAVSVTF